MPLKWPVKVGISVAIKRYSVRPSVRLSVLAWAHSSKPAAAGLLLSARQEGDVDRLLQQRRVNARAVTRC